MLSNVMASASEIAAELTANDKTSARISSRKGVHIQAHVGKINNEIQSNTQLFQSIWKEGEFLNFVVRESVLTDIYRLNEHKFVVNESKFDDLDITGAEYTLHRLRMFRECKSEKSEHRCDLAWSCELMWKAMSLSLWEHHALRSKIDRLSSFALDCVESASFREIRSQDAAINALNMSEFALSEATKKLRNN